MSGFHSFLPPCLLHWDCWNLLAFPSLVDSSCLAPASTLGVTEVEGAWKICGIYIYACVYYINTYTCMYIYMRVCVWTVWKDVKLLFHHVQGARPPVMTLPNKASHWRGSRVWSTLCTCILVEHDFNMVNFVETLVMRVCLPFFKLLLHTYLRWNIHYHDISTEYAKVCVKVCNLWWRSDMVPQGRGVDPVQPLSRR